MVDFSHLAFEEAYEELESIIARLEDGDLPLEKSMSLFERGRQLSDHCQKLLDSAELRITQIGGE